MACGELIYVAVPAWVSFSLGTMPVRFASSYVDRLFAERNLVGLHHLVSVLERDRVLPDGCWLYCRIIEWVGSIRSGVWQYYERVPRETFERVSRAFDKFGYRDIAEHYCSGMAIWDGPDKAASLDKWIEINERKIQDAALEMIKPLQEILRSDN